jgi:hypothetical protein
VVEAAGKYGDCAGRQRRLVRGGVDAAGKAGGNGMAVAAEVAGDAFGGLDSGDRSVARADDGDRRAGEDRGVAAHRDQRRGAVYMRQPGRIVALAEGDEAGTQPGELRHFLFGGVDRADADRPPASPGELRHRLDRRGGAAKMIEELAEGRRSDPVAANEAQPGEALRVVEPFGAAPRVVGAHAFWPILLSVPAASRWMFVE